MPIYHYTCAECKNDFELYFTTYLQSTKVEKTCPDCGGDNVTKLVVPCSFKLEGEGWYKDGYTYKERENLKHAQD